MGLWLKVLKRPVDIGIDCTEWYHDMDTLSALLTSSEGNPSVIAESSHKGTVMPSFDISVVVCLNNLLNLSICRWFEAPGRLDDLIAIFINFQVCQCQCLLFPGPEYPISSRWLLSQLLPGRSDGDPRLHCSNICCQVCNCYFALLNLCCVVGMSVKCKWVWIVPILG